MKTTTTLRSSNSLEFLHTSWQQAKKATSTQIEKMKMKPQLNTLLHFAVVAITLFGVNETRAASATWITPSGSANWVDGANWNPAVAPGGSVTESNMDVATFSTTLTGALTVAVDVNRNVGGLIFEDSSAYNINLTGGQLRLSSGGVIENRTTSGARTIDIPAVSVRGSSATATITSDSTNNASGRIRLSNGLGASGTATVTLNGANTAANSVGNITGALTLIKDGAGYWGLNGNSSTFTGGVTLKAGTLGFNSSGSSFGTGTLTINGGTLKSDNATAATINTNAIVVGGNFTVADSTPNTNDVTFSGAMNLGGATRTITASTVGTSVFAFSGVISNGGLTKDGLGALTLKGKNTYTGDTTVTVGTLVLAANSGTYFEIGANGINNQIKGNGTIQLDGEFTFDLSSAGVDLNDSWNIVNVGTLAETFGGTFSVKDFSDLGSGIWELTGVNGGRTYQFSQTSGILSVTAVPEPSTLVMLCVGLAAMAFRRPRRMR